MLDRLFTINVDFAYIETPPHGRKPLPHELFSTAEAFRCATLTIRQTVLFPDLFEWPVIATSDQDHAASDGGAILLVTADRALALTKDNPTLRKSLCAAQQA